MSIKETTLLWQTRGVRVTAFPSPSGKIEQPTWWRELLGTDPETRNLRPSRGEVTEQGPFDSGVLTLSVTPLRIDWTLNKDLNLNSEDNSIPSLGGFHEVGDKFIKLMVEWLGRSTMTPLRRLAFGATLDQPVKNLEEGYKLLAQYLPPVEISPNSRDFYYQINRPRELKSFPAEKLIVNRLSKWSCASLQRAILQSLDFKQNISVLSESIYACNLEIDISTPADFMGEFPQQALAHILQEQYELGKEVAAKGDIA